MNFSHFVKHESCPKCGSRDNLARYSDGGAFCFGCHYQERRTHAPINQPLKGDHPPLPDDINHEFSQPCIEWLASFHVDVPTAIRNGLVWSPRFQQLIYQLGDVWQARNFDPERLTKRKNYTSGDVNGCLHIYDNPGRELGTPVYDGLVIVEDPLSALRVSSIEPSLPLLGSHLATGRLNALAGLYDSFVVWLDSDKYKEARAIAERLRLVGLSARVIWTELDPKCYTDLEIKDVLSHSDT